jgi:hypothetical protein
MPGGARPGDASHRSVAPIGSVCAIGSVWAICASTIARSTPVGRPAEAHPQAVLADLELSQACRSELGDQGREQLADRAGDGRPVGPQLGSGSLGLAGFGLGRFGHGLDLLSSGRLVA